MPVVGHEIPGVRHQSAEKGGTRKTVARIEPFGFAERKQAFLIVARGTKILTFFEQNAGFGVARNALFAERLAVEEIAVRGERGERFVKKSERLIVFSGVQVAIYLFDPTGLGFRLKLFVFAAVEALDFRIQVGEQRIDIVQDIQLAGGIGELAALFILAGTADDGGDQIAAGGNEFQG